MIAKSAGGDSGAIKQGGTYYVYANVTGSGTPPAGLGSLTTDVSAITTSQTAAALTSGSYTIDGQSYNYRSAQLTAKSSLSAGTSSFTVKLTDSAGTATTTSYSVTVDNTAPRASNIQTANVSGGTIGKPETGDTVTFTFSEPIDPDTVLSGWDGSSQSVIVAILDGGSSGDDKLEVLNASTLATLPFGTVDLGRKDYVTKTTAFGATGTAVEHGAERQHDHRHAGHAERDHRDRRRDRHAVLDAFVHRHRPRGQRDEHQLGERERHLRQGLLEQLRSPRDLPRHAPRRAALDHAPA